MLPIDQISAGQIGELLRRDVVEITIVLESQIRGRPARFAMDYNDCPDMCGF